MSSMFYEVLDAIEDFYKTDEEIQADCILWLKQITNDVKTQVHCDEWLDKHHRCPKCGTVLQTYNYRQPQPYQEGIVYEDMSEEFCPYCDGQMRLEDVVD